MLAPYRRMPHIIEAQIVVVVTARIKRNNIALWQEPNHTAQTADAFRREHYLHLRNAPDYNSADHCDVDGSPYQKTQQARHD